VFETYYIYTNKDRSLILCTQHNPLTFRDYEVFAGYMGIKGNRDKVLELVNSIFNHKSNIKGISSNKLEFCNIPNKDTWILPKEDFN